METEECRSLETNFALPWFPQQKQTKVDEMSQQQHELLSKSAQKLDCTTNAAKLASLYVYILRKCHLARAQCCYAITITTTSWPILGSNHVFKMWDLSASELFILFNI